MVLWTKERGMRNKLQIDLRSRIKAGCGKVDLGQCHTGASLGISFLNICCKHKKTTAGTRRREKKLPIYIAWTKLTNKKTQKTKNQKPEKKKKTKQLCVSFFCL